MDENQSGKPLTDEQALRQVLDVTRQLAAPSNLQSLLGKVMDAARHVLAADRGSLFLYDEAADELYTTIADGTQQIRISTSAGIAGQCARSRTIINVPDCYSDPRFNPEVDRKTGYRTSSLITVPLIGLEDKLVGVMQLLNASRGSFDERDEDIAEALASHAAVALQRAMLLEERIVKLKLERDLDLAREIQQGVLPEKLPVVPGYDMAVYSQPADKTGGDIYDVISLPIALDQYAAPPGATKAIMFMLADATGHGIGPALSVTQARAMLRIGLRLGAPLNDLVRQINAQVYQDLAESRFITAFMGQLDVDHHRVVYHSAGQGPLIHVRHKSGKCDFRIATTLPLGITDDLPMDEAGIINLRPGDLFVLLTDGFFEAHKPEGKQLGNKRIGEYLTQARSLPAQQIMDGLVNLFREFVDNAPPQDDLTGIILQRCV